METCLTQLESVSETNERRSGWKAHSLTLENVQNILTGKYVYSTVLLWCTVFVYNKEGWLRISNVDCGEHVLFRKPIFIQCSRKSVMLSTRLSSTDL